MNDAPAAVSAVRTRPAHGLVDSPDAILRRLGQKLDVFHLALSGFKSEGMRLVAELQQQVQNQNLALAGAAMHAMKGVAATVGAAALARKAADLEHRARSESRIAAGTLFHTGVIAALRDLIDSSYAALVATMPPDPVRMATPQTTQTSAMPPAQLVTRLREIQALLRVGNLRAIDMAEQLFALTSGEDRTKVQELHDATKALQFAAAEKTARSWLEGLP